MLEKNHISNQPICAGISFCVQTNALVSISSGLETVCRLCCTFSITVKQKLYFKNLSTKGLQIRTTSHTGFMNENKL